MTTYSLFGLHFVTLWTVQVWRGGMIRKCPKILKKSFSGGKQLTTAGNATFSKKIITWETPKLHFSQYWRIWRLHRAIKGPKQWVRVIQNYLKLALNWYNHLKQLPEVSIMVRHILWQFTNYLGYIWCRYEHFRRYLGDRNKIPQNAKFRGKTDNQSCGSPLYHLIFIHYFVADPWAFF